MKPITALTSHWTEVPGKGAHRELGGVGRLAIACPRQNWVVDIKLTDLPRLHITEGGKTTPTPQIRVPLLMVKSVQPAISERAAESQAPVAGREPLTGPRERQAQLVPDQTHRHLYRCIGRL